MSENYYFNQLYPLQDVALKIIAEAQSDFYLTGGTALGRHYLHHRFSDDLDFFLNLSKDFTMQVDKCLEKLREAFGVHLEESIKGDSFMRCFVNKEETTLKIEFVNDVLYRVTKPIHTSLYVRTDSIENIISNKICALSRSEAKDLADIWHITQNFTFSWQEVIKHAKQKDTWVDETEILLMLKEFDPKKLQEVKWIIPFDLEKARRDIEIIKHDILLGQENSLYPSTKN